VIAPHVDSLDRHAGLGLCGSGAGEQQADEDDDEARARASHDAAPWVSGSREGAWVRIAIDGRGAASVRDGLGWQRVLSLTGGADARLPASDS
jgi:hypothetical protein